MSFFFFFLICFCLDARGEVFLYYYFILFLPKNRITLSSFNQIKIILVLQIKGVDFILDRFFFFWDMFRGERGIRTSDFHLIRRGPSQLSYLLDRS
jgi:hypothetical protein